jgi:16S rRNA (cytosine967-C5)-methyltransferase
MERSALDTGIAYRSAPPCAGKARDGRRLRQVSAAPNDLSSTHALPLSELLGHAADALQAVRAGRSLDDALAPCPAQARPGTQAISFHVLRWLGSAQALRAKLAPKTPPPAIDALLCCALALLWPPGAPPYADHTLVDQAVRAARARGAKGRDGGAFINAVLRRFLRERETWVVQLTAPDADAVARWNHPAWWVARLRADWPAHWQQLLEADNRHPPMMLRVNARRADAAAFVARLAALDIGARAIGSHAVVLDKPRPVAQIPGFAEGEVSVQDAAAQRAAPLLIGAGLAANARVLDACAAPGGKTAHLLELAALDVLALDRDALRLTRVGETLGRLGLHARLLAADAGDPAAWWDGVAFDAILLDAPCSASGIVRRHPDVRWLRRASDIAALAGTQARLLDALWPLLKPGGRLLYCTCSVFKAEGEASIDAFLQRQRGDGRARRLPAPGHLLPLADNGDVGAGSPAHIASDGFFYALVEKAVR